jgi:hypothetical protein
MISDLYEIVAEDFTDPKRKKIKVAIELCRLIIAFIALDFAPCGASFDIALEFDCVNPVK